VGYKRFNPKDGRRARNNNTRRCQNEGKGREWKIGNAAHSINRNEDVDRVMKVER